MLQMSWVYDMRLIESEMGLILLSGDENMCIEDTDRKIQEEECWKVIEIYLSLI